ncbi:MAG: baseplate J/gp47 family protein, partial [Oscillospiraceae bacterium]|nr:baseplate J/gp47 family protein [Oscillospiraceae bacterium]
DGVAAACVLPRNRGLGTVDIILTSPSGVPSVALLSSVQKNFEAQREICVDVRVSAPTTVTVPVSVAISIKAGYNYDSVSSRVKAELQRFFNGTLLGKDVLLAKLGQVVFGVEGVSNYSFSLPSADITVAANVLPIAGVISVIRR